MHRHVDQLVARVPNLGVSDEVTHEAPDLDQEQPTLDHEGSEENRRSGRVRRSPAWTKDYQMESN